MIYFVAANPGGLRALLPVFHEYSGKKTLHITSNLKNLLLNIDSEIEFKILPNQLSTIDSDKELINSGSKLLLSGTSVTNSPGGQIENNLRLSAKRLGIPSISIVDHWTNYSARFSSESNTPLNALPDFICIPDNRAYREMIQEGFPKEILLVTGQPAFDKLTTEVRDGVKTRRAYIRNLLHIGDSVNVVGFASEPVAIDYGNLRNYNEQEVLADTIKVTESIGMKTIIRPHPRESIEKFSKHQIIVSDQINSYDYVAACDFIVGMTSILLIEAALIGKPVCSFQPNIDEDAPWRKFIYPISVVTSKDELKSFLNNPNSIGIDYRETNATSKILSLINGLD